MDSRISGEDAATLAISPPSFSPNPSPRPTYTRAPASNPNLSTLPPLTTSSLGSAAHHRKVASQTSKHLPTFSTSSAASTASRPPSHVFPQYQSSLPYALVRDFAYPTYSQLHYGVPPDQMSSVSTPASEARRASDPHGALRGSGLRGLAFSDHGSNDSSYFGLQLPSRSFGDGPPYAEDADLLSPIVTSTKHKKTRSNLAEYEYSAARYDDGAYATNSQGFGQISDLPMGQPYSSLNVNNATLQPTADQQIAWQRRLQDETQSFDPSITPDLHASSTSDDYSPSEPVSEELNDTSGSRLSRAYQFTIASPDEEFHGKAVALFDFERQHDNELPFIEGQVLWVSYRHGEGWLVAQDPKSGESGLIPEEFVRLLRDIEGGLSGLKGDDFTEEDADLDTPVDLRRGYDRPMSGGSRGPTYANGDHYTPVVSHFTTSSKDLEPYSLSSIPPSQSAPLGSQQTTPIASPQSQFGARDPTLRSDELGGGGGGGVLLSPETFKREQPRLPDDEEQRLVDALEDERSLGHGVADLALDGRNGHS